MDCDHKLIRLADGERGEAIYTDGVLTGIVRGAKYITFRDKEHFFKKHRGFGLSADVIRRLKRLKVRKVIIIYSGAKGEIEFRSDLEQWIRSKNEWIWWTDSGERDIQKILSVDEFDKEKGQGR